MFPYEDGRILISLVKNSLRCFPNILGFLVVYGFLDSLKSFLGDSMTYWGDFLVVFDSLGSFLGILGLSESFV